MVEGASASPLRVLNTNNMFSDDSDGEAGPKHVYLRQNTRTDKVIVYWVSYLDGIQRVLLLTQDERIAKRAIKVR